MTSSFVTISLLLGTLSLADTVHVEQLPQSSQASSIGLLQLDDSLQAQGQTSIREQDEEGSGDEDEDEDEEDDDSEEQDNQDKPLSILAQMPDMVGLPMILNLNQKKSQSIYSTLQSVLAQDDSQQEMASSALSLSPKTASSLELSQSSDQAKPLALAQGIGGSSSPFSIDSDTDSQSSPFGEFICGVILICLALPMVWMNERKQVKMFKIVQQARENVIEVQIDNVTDINNYKLVHASGRCTTQQQVNDERFDISKDDCVKIKRVVEVYQWVEHSETHEENGRKTTKYSYSKEWKEDCIDSNSFAQAPTGHDSELKNPSNWPCSSDQFTNSQVDLGQFVLSDAQICRMNQFEDLNLTQVQSQAVNASAKVMQKSGWQQLLPSEGNSYYLYSRPTENSKGTQLPQWQEQVGDMRINWKVVNCCQINVVAQQIENNEKDGALTFRQWNPEKETVAWGEDNSGDSDPSCPITCICCWAVEFIFKSVFQEVVDVLEYNDQSSEKLFDNMDTENKQQTSIIRVVSWLMSVLGHYLLFSPIISLLAWIPLVGSLLAGVLALAAIIFALVWATLLHFLIMGVSWLVYRPIFGGLLLGGVAILIGICCY